MICTRVQFIHREHSRKTFRALCPPLPHRMILGKEVAKRPGSVGIPMRNREMVGLDDTDTEGGPNQITKLVVRGANILQGYWNAPEEKAKRFRGAATALTPFSISLTCSAGTTKEY
jgi:acyl-CoA synthetase (AMP-forming)/AMP-acid ligase II